jgi:hypothetical protein
MFPMLFSWAWALLCAALAISVWKRSRRPLFRMLLIAGLSFNVLAGLANGLVITANGLHMPVEKAASERMATAPRILCDEGDEDGLVCKTLSVPLVVIDFFRPKDIHKDVGPDDEVRLRWLDDRFPLRFCERSTIYSLGDAFAVIGWSILLPALVCAFLARLIRGIRRIAKRSNPP